MSRTYEAACRHLMGFEGWRYGCVGVWGRCGEGCVKRVERGFNDCFVEILCVA